MLGDPYGLQVFFVTRTLPVLTAAMAFKHGHSVFVFHDRGPISNSGSPYSRFLWSHSQTTYASIMGGGVMKCQHY